MERDVIESLYTRYAGHEPVSVTPLAGAGSSRRYYRVSGAGGSVIATVGDDVKENDAFVYLSKHFAESGLPVPHVLSASDDGMAYLQTDLGDVSLFSLLPERGEREMALLEETMKMMADVQHIGARHLDFGRCFPLDSMNRRSVMWDLNYFKYCFLKPVLEFSEPQLEDDFERLCLMLLDGMDGCDTFMVRDFQSRNVMVCDGKPFLIDFQGGRRGPVHYDVASFLWQAKAGFTASEREHLIDVYLEYASRYCDYDRTSFIERLHLFVLFRSLQVLGAYGFRGYLQQKAHFVTSIPAAVANVKAVIPHIPRQLGYLAGLLAELCDVPELQPQESHSGLTVRVCSFSYKKGLPRDLSGNGGGFVFDCRAVHNPGRYEQYKALTGMDSAVRKFLEDDGEMLEFLKNAYAMVDASVARYVKRGFSSLQVGFGCTGGRHRSVYGAEAMARHINEHFGVRVVLEHREQCVTKIFPPR